MGENCYKLPQIQEFYAQDPSAANEAANDIQDNDNEIALTCYPDIR